MSKTDKTDPYWVKVERYGVEHHDHRNTDCTMDDYLPYVWPRTPWLSRQTCYKDLTWGDMQTAFASHKDPWNSPNKLERGIRARLRADMAEARKLDDYEDLDIPPYQPRHGASWWA
jgi:hypothetical protein